MAENIGGFNVDTLSYQVPLAYEAKAIYYYEQGVFDEAYKESIKWQEDEPFSIRPIKAASYISSFFYKDYQTSIALTRKGLQIKPNEVVLSNNLVYYLLQDGKLDEAIPLFEKTIRNVILKPDHYPESEQLYCNATAGLIFFKQNQAELGKLYYNKAIDIAKKMKNGYLIALAVVNYTKAALNFADDDDANSLIKQLKDTCKYITAEDIKFMYNEILKDYYRAETHG
jgi:Tfp pilus assembly protein PilF